MLALSAVGVRGAAAFATRFPSPVSRIPQQTSTAATANVE